MRSNSLGVAKAGNLKLNFVAKSIGIHFFGFEDIFRCYRDNENLKQHFGHMHTLISTIIYTSELILCSTIRMLLVCICMLLVCTRISCVYPYVTRVYNNNNNNNLYSCPEIIQYRFKYKKETNYKRKVHSHLEIARLIELSVYSYVTLVYPYVTRVYSSSKIVPDFLCPTS